MKQIVIMQIGIKKYAVPALAYYITQNEFRNLINSVRSINFSATTDKLIDYIISDPVYQDMELKPADVLELVKPVNLLVKRNGCGILFTYDLSDDGIGILYENGSFAQIGTQQCAKQK